MPYQTIYYPTHLLVILVLLLSINPTTTTQPSPPSDNYGSPLPTNAIIIVVVVFSASFFTCYFRQFTTCFRAYVFGAAEDGGNNDDGEIRRRESPHGLDPKILATFPIFLYSDVKIHVVRKITPLECAICLNEFVDHDHLQLLPRCSHVFHPDCIAPWLAAHVTCPECRANIETEIVDDQKLPGSLAQPSDDESQPSNQIRPPPRGDVHRDIIVHIGSSPETMIKSPIVVQSTNDVGERRGFFPRSHSTGRSLVEDRERYTLRLPEEVRNKLVNINNVSGLPAAIVSPRTGYRSRRSVSCATIQDKPDQWRFTMSPPFISRSGSTGIAECSNNSNNNNLGVIMKSPRSFFKSMKSPNKSPLNRVVRCDDIGERSSDRLWSNPTSQELELEGNSVLVNES